MVNIKQLAKDIIPSNIYRSTNSIPNIKSFYTPNRGVYLVTESYLSLHSEIYRRAQMAHDNIRDGRCMCAWKIPFETHNPKYTGKALSQKTLAELHEFYHDPIRNKVGSRTYNLAWGINYMLVQWNLYYSKYK